MNLRFRWERFPRAGAVVVVANHPFGFLDGLVLDAVLQELRADVKILADSLLWGIEELRDSCLPVDVFGGYPNLRPVRQALQLLAGGGGVAIYFAGANSLAFQIAGLVHARLRTARLAGELFNKRGLQVVVRIGTSIEAAGLAKQGSIERATRYLRARTYVLNHHRSADLRYQPADSKIVPFQTSGLRAEMERLKIEGRVAVENESYAVFRARGNEIPTLMREIGRARELAFRAAGEGTGKDLDLDVFDRSYTHLILWHKASECIAGSYRLAWTEDILRVSGVR